VRGDVRPRRGVLQGEQHFLARAENPGQPQRHPGRLRSVADGGGRVHGRVVGLGEQQWHHDGLVEPGFGAGRRDGADQVGFAEVQERRDGAQAGPQRLGGAHHLADHRRGPGIAAAVRQSDQRREGAVDHRFRL
jgi:hypothetical protein